MCIGSCCQRPVSLVARHNGWSQLLWFWRKEHGFGRLHLGASSTCRCSPGIFCLCLRLYLQAWSLPGGRAGGFLSWWESRVATLPIDGPSSVLKYPGEKRNIDRTCGPAPWEYGCWKQPWNVMQYWKRKPYWIKNHDIRHPHRDIRGQHNCTPSDRLPACEDVREPDGRTESPHSSSFTPSSCDHCCEDTCLLLDGVCEGILYS